MSETQREPTSSETYGAVGERPLNITAPSFDESEVESVRQCLQSGWVTQGPITAEFERRFAERHRVRYALATTSCTSALHLATSALGLKSGDEVVVPAFTWVTSAHCAEYVGAKAVFADISVETFNLDAGAFRAAITPRTRAVVVVHLFGLSAEMDELIQIAKRHNIAIIEDAACAVGTEYDGVPVGGIGDVGCFSFHPRKVITTGEGGMVTTNDVKLGEKVQPLRNHGSSPSGLPSRPYHMSCFDVLGYNLRLSDIQAAVGVAQMDKLDDLLAERRLRAERYTELLANVAEIACPTTPSKCGHTYQSYVVRVLEGGATRRNVIMDALESAGVQTRPGTHAVHRLGYYRNKYGLRAEQFPAAVTAEDTTITLPIFPGMIDDQQDYVADSLRSALQHKTVPRKAA